MTRFLLLLPLAVAACSGDDCPDLNGDWTLSVTDVTSSCGAEDDWTSAVQIAQDGCEATRIEVTGIKGDAAAVTGTVDGDEITLSGRFDDGGGVTELTLTVSQESADEFTGTEAWEWFATAQDEDPACTDGTAAVTLTRD